MKPWIAEHEVDASLARALIAEQFPELGSAVELAPIGAGWDNVAFLVNGAYVFRFPRRAIAAPLIDAEVRALSLVAPRVSACKIRVPEPRFVGRPTARFPAPFAGYPWIPGEMATALPFDLATRSRIVEPLAEFLRALHAIDAAEAFAVGLEGDTIGRLDVEIQRRRQEARLGPHAALFDEAARAFDARPPYRLTLVHGDLHARQILIDETGALTGVIDWGDVHAGDPAVDLSVVFIMLPSELHAEFFAHYGAIDAATHSRARFRAICHSIASLAYELDAGVAAALRSVEQSLAWLNHGP